MRWIFSQISDSDRRAPADWGQESQASSWVEAWNSACLSRCPRGERPLVELYLEPRFFSERCTERLSLRVDFIHRVEFGEVSVIYKSTYTSERKNTHIHTYTQTSRPTKREEIQIHGLNIKHRT